MPVYLCCCCLTPMHPPGTRRYQQIPAAKQLVPYLCGKCAPRRNEADVIARVARNRDQWGVTAMVEGPGVQ